MNIFPSKDLGKLSLYLVISIVMTSLSAGGLIFSVINTFAESPLYVIGNLLAFIVSLAFTFILRGYEISVMKTGITSEETAPEFVWKENLVTGIKYFILNIVYKIIPTIIVVIVAFATNVPGNVTAIANEVASSLNATATANSLNLANGTAGAASFNLANVTDMTSLANMVAGSNATMPVISIPQSLISSLSTSLAITAIIGVIAFIIFGIFQRMGEARLAKTDGLGYSLNMIEAFKDIGRIGWGKVIATLILIIIVILAINLLAGIIVGLLPMFAVVFILIIPYQTFFASRALGLLYSDIA